VTAGHRPGPRGHRPCRPVAPGPAGSRPSLGPAAAAVPQPSLGPAAAAVPQPPLRPAAAVVPPALLRVVGLALLLRVVGVAALLVGSLLLAGCQRPAAQDIGQAAVAPSTGAAARGDLPVGRPTRVVIPAVGVEARVVPVGLQADGAMEVPDVDLAGWYEPGPRPGEPGPAVIVGHVDSRSGPAVFSALHRLRPGDRIVVGQDGTPASVFAVERLERQPKAALPVGRIWNRTKAPVLRLITCGGSFDRSTGHYRDNLIVYAALAS
jgi:Sortase domain